MRQVFLFGLITVVSGCSNQANHVGNPLLLPISAIGNGIENAAYQQRRGQVEVIVKSNFPDILDEISIGSGDTLTSAMNAANIRGEERPARILQMQGDLMLYQNNPEALVVALMVYGS